MKDDSTRHLTPRELADRLTVPLETIYTWNRRGGGPRYLRVGRHVRYRLEDVESWEFHLIRGSGRGDVPVT